MTTSAKMNAALPATATIIAIPNAPPSVDAILKIADATPTLFFGVVDTAVSSAGVANSQ